MCVCVCFGGNITKMGRKKGGKKRKNNYKPSNNKKKKLTVVDDSQYLFNQFFAPQQDAASINSTTSSNIKKLPSPSSSSSSSSSGSSSTRKITTAYKANPNPQFLGPYSDRQSILVVGDGDLSFSLSLATALSGTKLTATTYDSFGIVCKKYEKASGTIASLKASGANVIHSIDATQLDIYDWNTKFNRIIFNFPHIGGSTPSDVLANQSMLFKFFKASKKLLVNSKSEIHISLRTTPFYKSWDIKTIGSKAGYKLRKKLDFNEDLFMRYENQRTAGDAKFRSAPSTGDSKTYMFRYIGVYS